MRKALRPSHWMSVRTKLAFAILGTACVSLVLACGLFIFNEVRTFRASLTARVTVLADVLALNSAVPLDFDDAEKATEILGGMAAAPSIDAAGLYTQQGNLYSSFVREGVAFEMPSTAESGPARFTGSHLVLFRPVARDGQVIGSVGLVSDLKELQTRLNDYYVISASVLAVSLALAMVLGYFLQKTISRPISSLAATAHLVSEKKDYTARAQVETPDEIGLLATAFNEMLSGIQERDGILVSANEELKTQVDARLQAQNDLKALNEDLERRVEERTGELRRSNKELEQFAYIASHDLQEPLRMVVSYLQLIERRYSSKLDAEGLQFMKFAVDGGQRMQTLIHDLLSYSRVHTHKRPFEAVDLNATMQAVSANLKVAVAESGATITTDVLPTVFGDSTQLAQLLQNLLSNGIKFRGKDALRIHVSAERTGHEWRVSVQDNGIGIAPEYFERIFVIFQRLHSRDEYPGTGIGLAVCQRIVERHGGRIWVESRPGHGSKFSFTIPDFVSDGI